MPKDLRSSYPRRRDFERGANLLLEELDNGRILFSSHLKRMEDSFLRVRKLSNGRLNLGTVDELVRTHFHFLVSNPFDKVNETKK